MHDDANGGFLRGVERAMIRERTWAGIAAARAEGRIGGRRKKLNPVKRREIAESVISGRKSGAYMARLQPFHEASFRGVISIAAPAPIRFEQRNWRNVTVKFQPFPLRHLRHYNNWQLYIDFIL
jgi:DNA invertase Pin-like site-specific DNA recombinase